jgi:hypothetical protein
MPNEPINCNDNEKKTKITSPLLRHQFSVEAEDFLEKVKLINTE